MAATTAHPPSDTPGSVSGQLTVLRESERPGRRSLVCRCSCGEEYTCRADDFRRGTVTRCLDCRRPSLVGDVYGKLTVEAPLKRRANNGAVIYRCKCECGRQAKVSRSNLVGEGPGKSRSCGKCRHE